MRLLRKGVGLSKITIALEASVAEVKQNLPVEGERQTARKRAAVDKAFARILTLIAPRIRHFIRQYGLVGHWEDAQQVCSIAVLRAIEAYDPEKAQFTTFVNWQIRGELQSLRFRVMTDQRPSARKVEATTISLDAMSVNEDGEEMSAIALIRDEDALARTESAASAYLAEAATKTLVDQYISHLHDSAMSRLRRQARPKRGETDGQSEGRRSVWRSESSAINPADLEELETRLSQNREVVETRLFDMPRTAVDGDDFVNNNKERARQIAKRAAKAMAELAAQDTRFSIMTDYRKAANAE